LQPAERHFSEEDIFSSYQFEVFICKEYEYLVVAHGGAVVETLVGAHGGAVVEALHYKPEGRGIDSRWCLWNFSLI
jgi:hypothetical protein